MYNVKIMLPKGVELTPALKVAITAAVKSPAGLAAIRAYDTEKLTAVYLADPAVIAALAEQKQTRPYDQLAVEREYARSMEAAS